MKQDKRFNSDVLFDKESTHTILSKMDSFNPAITKLKNRIIQDRMFCYGFSLVTNFRIQYFIASIDEDYNQIRCFGLEVKVKFENDQATSKYILVDRFGQEVQSSGEVEKLDIARPLRYVSINGLFKSERFVDKKLMFIKVPGMIGNNRLDMSRIVSRCFPSNTK